MAELFDGIGWWEKCPDETNDSIISLLFGVFPISFSDHNELRDHFIENHFLCQEDGECKENIFSAVFRTDIDLKGENTHI